MTDIKIKRKLSFKAKTLATLIAIASAVIIPQVCHIAGASAGVGTALGELLLPMHLPILLVGILAGPLAGCVAGALSPLISFALTSMPSLIALPFMIIELAAYGLICGLLRNTKISTIVKVIIAQVSGRAVRAIAILISYYAIGYTQIAPISIINGLKSGIIGIILQLALIPLIVYRVEYADKQS